MANNVARARDLDFCWKRIVGGFTWYPYQISLGISLRYWPCIFAPSLRVHLGPCKFWIAFLGNEPLKRREVNRE